MQVLKKRRKKQHVPMGFLLLGLLPTVILVGLFLVYPMIKSAVFSLYDMGVLQKSGDYIGLENYIYLFTKDDSFQRALVNTLKTIVVVPVITIAIAFVLAVLLHRSNLREKNLYITFYFFPYFMSSTVVAVVWCFVFFPTSSGILNNILIHLGLENLTRVWLGDSKTALWCICAVIIWCCIGYYVVLYLSGLDSISSEIYEAATIDGASAWQQVTRITLPLMKNILGITLVLLMSGTLAVTFTYSKIMTNGGPSGSTTVLLQYIYKQGIEQGNVGYASAVTVFTMFLGISLAVLSRVMTSKSEKE